MNQYERTNDDIRLLSHIPPARIATLFLFLFGLTVGLLPQFANNRDEIGPLGLAVLFLCGAATVYLGVLLGNNCKRKDVFLKRSTGALRIEQKGWFNSKISSDIFERKEIQDFRIESGSDSEGDDVFKLLLKTTGGQSVTLVDGCYSREYLVEKKVLLNESINFAMSASATLETIQNKQKIPSLFWIIGAAVISFPFLAAIAGQLAGFKHLDIAAGQPTQETLKLLQSLASPLLLQGEKILWVAQPEPGREMLLKWMMIQFAIFWTLLSLFWTFLALCSAQKNPLGYLLVVFGIPFICFGFGLLSIPYFSHQQELNTVYLLTDRGAIRIVNQRPVRLCNYSDKDFGPVEATRYKADRTDLMFIKNSSEGDKHPYGGFYGIEDADTALRILQEAQSKH